MLAFCIDICLDFFSTIFTILPCNGSFFSHNLSLEFFYKETLPHLPIFLKPPESDTGTTGQE